MAQIPQTSWPPIFGPSIDSETHASCFSVCICQRLSTGTHAIPTIPLDPSNFNSLFLGGIEAAQRHPPLASDQPPAWVSFIFTHSSSLFKLCAINTLTTPTGPVPSPLQDAEKHPDLRVTCPFGIPARSTPRLPPEIAGAACPFPKPTPGGREEGYCVLHFYTICLQLHCFNLLKDSNLLKDFFFFFFSQEVPSSDFSVAVTRVEQGLGATWDLPPITVILDKLEGRGSQPTELPPEQGPMNEVQTAPGSV